MYRATVVGVSHSRLHDVPLNLRLPAEVKAALAAEAERTGVTVSALTRTVLAGYLNEIAPPRTRDNLRDKRAATATRTAMRRDQRAERQRSANTYRPVIRASRER